MWGGPSEEVWLEKRFGLGVLRGEGWGSQGGVTAQPGCPVWQLRGQLEGSELLVGNRGEAARPTAREGP